MDNLYTDEKQDAVRSLQESADKAIEEYHKNPYDVKDIVMDVLFFFIILAAAFGWMMLMLLIISFVSLSYLHFDIKVMVGISIVFAIVMAAMYAKLYELPITGGSDTHSKNILFGGGIYTEEKITCTADYKRLVKEYKVTPIVPDR